MLTSIVIELKAINSYQEKLFSGELVQGFWYKHWKNVNAELSKYFHGNSEEKFSGFKPFTISPICPYPSSYILPGQSNWIRITNIGKKIVDSFCDDWLANIPGQIRIGPCFFDVKRIMTSQDQHEWASSISLEGISALLSNHNPPDRWNFEFYTPLTFHGNYGHFPIPYPLTILNNWLRKWNSLNYIQINDQIFNQVESQILVSYYKLQSLSLSMKKPRMLISGIGKMSIFTKDVKPGINAALDLLSHFSFFCGTGQLTTRGLGMTRLLER